MGDLSRERERVNLFANEKKAKLDTSLFVRCPQMFPAAERMTKKCVHVGRGIEDMATHM
jgi:hypothetical protein